MEQSGIVANSNAPVFETCAAVGPDFSLHPMLALGWERRGSATWRLHLRAGVRFHNGASFDAGAVVHAVNERWGKGPNSLAVGPESAVLIDSLTVDITPLRPNHRLIQQLAHPGRRIMAPGTHLGTGATAESTPTGTGPFRFVHYVDGEEVVVDRFDEYWGKKPSFRRITFRFMRDGHGRIEAFKAGGVDAVYDVPRDEVPTVETDPRLKIVRSPVGMYSALLLNHRGRYPYDVLTDVRVRRALACGIDRDAIIRDAWQGNADATPTIVPAGMLGRHAALVQGHRYDPAAAAGLLDAAGWRRDSGGTRTSGNRRLRLTMPVYSPEEQHPMPQVVRDQLAKLGVELEVVCPDPWDYGDRLRAGEGDIFASLGNQADANPLFLASLFTGVAPGGTPAYGERFGAGEAYDEAFRDGFACPDPEDARRHAAKAMHIAVDQAVVAIPIAAIYRIWGLAKEIQGFEPHPAKGHQRWDRVYRSPDAVSTTSAAEGPRGGQLGQVTRYPTTGP